MNLTINKKGHKHLLLFVHGLTGGITSFYDPKDEKYFFDYFDEAIIGQIDIGFLEYYSEAKTWEAVKFWFKSKVSKIFNSNDMINNLKIEELSISAINEISKHIDDYDSINFICHSMGGLIVKASLVKDKRIYEKTNFYITLGTPHRGTKTAKYEYGMNRQVEDLKENSQIINYLTYQFATIKDHINCRYYVASNDEWVKPQDNAFPMQEVEKIFIVNCSHEEISKPRMTTNLIPLIKDVNSSVREFLSLKKPQSINEILEIKLSELGSKIDQILSQCCQETQLEQSLKIMHDEIDLLPGYMVKNIVSYKQKCFFILLTKDGNTNNILIKYCISKGLDKEFANNGIYTIDFNSNNTNMHNILLRNEYIYILGESVQNKHFNIAITKINIDGVIDSTYANNGIFLYSIKDEHLYANNSILLDNGNIITCGANFQKKVLLLMCIDLDGNLLEESGNKGIIEEKYDEGQAWANCICKYDENSFIIAGRTGSWEIFVSKFNNNGQRDTISFINAGMTKHKHFLRVEDLKVQSNGKILVAGVGNEGRVIRLNANGEHDLSFADKGVLEVITNHRSEVLVLELFSNDSFIVGGMEYDGNSIQNAIVATYTENGELNDSIFTNGFKSFKIVGKTSVKKIIIQSDNEISLISNYNIDHSQNKRTKVAVSNIYLNSIS